jgi:hypothetical protein
MTGLPLERRLAKFLGVFSFGLGIAQLAAPGRVNKLIGVKDTSKTRAIQRAVGVQELGAAQGIFAISPPTPILWTRVAGDVLHLGMLSNALRTSVVADGRRFRRKERERYDTARLLQTIGATVGIAIVDSFVSARYQARWPKEPTGVTPLPTRRDELHVRAHVEGYPAVTIRASESEIRPRLNEFDLDGIGNVTFREAPGDRGTEVVVQTNKHAERVKAKLRQVKQLIEAGEIVRSEGAPEGPEAKRQLFQRPAQPLKEKQLAKIGGRS